MAPVAPCGAGDNKSPSKYSPLFPVDDDGNAATDSPKYSSGLSIVFISTFSDTILCPANDIIVIEYYYTVKLIIFYSFLNIFLGPTIPWK